MIKFRIIDNVSRVKIGIAGTLPGLFFYGLIKMLNQIKPLIWILCITALVIIAYGIYSYLTNHNYSTLLTFVSVALGLLLLCGISNPHFEFVLESPQTIKTINDKFESDIEKLKSTGQNNPLSILEIDTNRLAEYYAINQRQAKSSFNWAIFSMVIGLSTIIAGIWLYYYYYEDDKGSGKVLITSLTTCAGIITNFISGFFIYLHNETQKRSLIYYNNLVKNQQIQLSITIANNVTNESERNEIKKEIIKKLYQRGSL